MTKEEITEVEAIVNSHVLAAEGCSTEVSDIESARKKGAMALFGEKYGDRVRVVSIGTSSVELCGGTHVSSTGEIGLFKIISESSVAAGVRRIEGTTGLGVLALLSDKDSLITETARELKAQNPNSIAKKAASLQAEIKETRRELESANARLSELKTQSLLENIETVGKFRLLTARIDATPDTARGLCDSVKSKFSDSVAVFAAVMGDRLNFVAAAGTDAVKAGAHAGNILREISAICGGKGGGRPDSAMSGGRDLDKIDEALAKVREILANI
jgi:alanyl-tRNA synthetase